MRVELTKVVERVHAALFVSSSAVRGIGPNYIVEPHPESMFCVGHAWVEMGVESRLPGLVAINSDHERGSIISWDLAQEPSVDELLNRARYLQTIGSPMA